MTVMRTLLVMESFLYRVFDPPPFGGLVHAVVVGAREFHVELCRRMRGESVPTDLLDS